MKYRTFGFLDNIYEWLAPKAKGVDVDTQEIKSLLESDKPCMISRFGSTELQTLSYSRYFPLLFPLKRRTYYNIQYASGFFPVTHGNLKKFFCLYQEDVKQLDLLISWRIEEFFFKDWLNKVPAVRKTTLDSFYEHEHPWTYALKGKHVVRIEADGPFKYDWFMLI